MDNYYVEIVEYDTAKAVKSMGPFSEHRADKVDNGANINLNHNEFFTQIVQRD